MWWKKRDDSLVIIFELDDVEEEEEWVTIQSKMEVVMALQKEALIVG
jgi:hypothetical protein